jgi:hypothetical protein
VTVDYQLERSDLVAFAEDYRRFVPGLSARLYHYGVLPALFVALGVALQSFPVAAIFAVLYSSTHLLFQHWIKRGYYDVVYSSDNASIQTLPRRVTLSDDGVTFSSDAGVLSYRWSFVRDVTHGPHYVCFVLTPVERTYIPTRAFRDDEHLKQFINRARSCLKPKAV